MDNNGLSVSDVAALSGGGFGVFGGGFRMVFLVGGVGTLQSVQKSANAIGKQKRESVTAHSFQSEYKALLPELD